MRRPSSPASAGQRRLVHEHRVRRVGGEAPLLRADQHDDRVRLEERQVGREHAAASPGWQVLDQVRGQHPLELRAAVAAARNSSAVNAVQPGVAAHRHRGGVVVDADAPRREVDQVAADAAADVERAALPEEPVQVPPVGGLDVEDALPAGAGAGREASGVGGGSGAAVGYGTSRTLPGGRGREFRRERLRACTFHHVDPRAAEDRPLPVHGDNRGLVQGELPAGQADGRGLPAVRDRAEQRVVQRRGRVSPAGSTPSRGTSTSRWRTGGRSRRSSTCATGRRSAASRPSSCTRATRSSCRAGAATATRR